jgi:hypothetical protein
MLDEMDTDTTHGINPKQLMNLLAIGTDRELACDQILNSDKEIKEFFQKLIHRKAPKESSIIDSILILLRETKAYRQSVVDHSLADLLLNPVTDLALLKAIKEYSKQIYQSTVSKGENSISLAIYYGAIASALVHHKEKI